MAKKVLLKDAATLLNGRAYKQDELLDSGKYPVLRVGKARPFHTTFNRQLHTVQALYGKQLRIPRFTRDELMQDLRTAARILCFPRSRSDCRSCL